jgi:diguanylate cyclase (GGDEF)-like protein
VHHNGIAGMHIEDKSVTANKAEAARSSDVSAEIQLLEQHQRLELAAQVGGLGVWDYDIAADRMTCDARWYAIMGRDPQNPIVSVSDFQSVIHPEDRERATEVEATARVLLSERRNYGIEFRIIRPDGEIRWVRSSAVIFDDFRGNATRAVGYVVDITDSWLAEEQLKQSNEILREENRLLKREALIDPLTGIGNRRALDQELERACALARRDGTSLAVAMIDIDHFKSYNDHYGHQQGDLALAAVAEAIASATWRPYDLAARYGGEEFCLILSDAVRPQQVIERVMENIRDLDLPHAKSPVAPRLTISCGCAMTSASEKLLPASLIAASDAQLYRAKNEGRNRIVIAGELP